METIWKIVESEFVWGIIVGLVVAIAGGWFQAHLTNRQQRRERRDLIKLFCLDLIHNLQRYAAGIASFRQHGNWVPKSIFILIDHELTAYGRQRDFLVLIDQETRTEFRELMNDISLKRVDIQVKVESVEEIFRSSRALDAAGEAAKARRIEQSADQPIKELGQEADNLVKIIQSATRLLSKLK